MWTEAHRARHEPGLKGLVAACAVEGVAAWWEGAGGGGRGGGEGGVAGAGRPAAERAGDAGPAGGRRDRLAPAGGRAVAEPAGRLAAVADRVRLVPALAGAGPVRRPAAGRGAPPAAQGREAAGADA